MTDFFNLASSKVELWTWPLGPSIKRTIRAYCSVSVISIGNNNIFLAKLIAEIWECGSKEKQEGVKKKNTTAWTGMKKDDGSLKRPDKGVGDLLQVTKFAAIFQSRWVNFFFWSSHLLLEDLND